MHALAEDETKPLAVSEPATAADQSEEVDLEKGEAVLRTEIERLRGELEAKVQLEVAKVRASESSNADRATLAPATEMALDGRGEHPVATAESEAERRADLAEKANAAAVEAEAQRKALEAKLEALGAADGEDAIQAAKTIIAHQQAMLQARDAEVDRMHDLQIAAASSRDAEIEIMNAKQRELEALRPELEELRRRCDPAVTGDQSEGAETTTQEETLITEIERLKSELAQSNAQLEAVAQAKDEERSDARSNAGGSDGDVEAIMAEQQTLLQARDAEVKRLHDSELGKQRELEALRSELDEAQRCRESLEQALKEAEAKSQVAAKSAS